MHPYTRSCTQLFAAKPQLDEDFSEDDLISSNSSSRRTSFSSLEAVPIQTSLNYGSIAGNERDQERSPVPLSQSRAFRRNSSTSDAARFREKLHSLSRSAEMHEQMMIESPVEDEASKHNVKEIFETTNANANNNSPGVYEIENPYSPPTAGGREMNWEQAHGQRMKSRDQSRSSTSSGSTSTGSDSTGSYDSGVLSVVNTGYDL